MLGRRMIRLPLQRPAEAALRGMGAPQVQEDGAVSYRDLTPEQALAAGGGELPAPTPWQRFSLLGLLLAAVLAVGVVGALSTA